MMSEDSVAELNDEIKRSEPDIKRAYVYIQADVLWQEAKRMYGIKHLDVIPSELAKAICEKNGWEFSGVFIYVARQSEDVNEKWYGIWNRIMNIWNKKYNLDVYCAPWSVKWLNVQNNKHLQDVREIYTAPVYVGDRSRNKMICDIISHAHYGEFDVCVMITRDQDLQPIADELRNISLVKKIWLKVVNAYPYEKAPEGEKPRNFRGINHTDWLQIDFNTYYDACFHGNNSEDDSEEDSREADIRD